MLPDQARPDTRARVVARLERERRSRTYKPKRERRLIYEETDELVEWTDYVTDHFLVLENRGLADAHDVKYRFLPPIDGSRPKEKAYPAVVQDHPIRHLLAGMEVRFPMSVDNEAARILELEISWLEDGNSKRTSVVQTITV